LRRDECSAEPMQGVHGDRELLEMQRHGDGFLGEMRRVHGIGQVSRMRWQFVSGSHGAEDSAAIAKLV
jgi:hypothetical protein